MNTTSHSTNYVLHNNFPHKSNSIRRSELIPVRVYHPHTPASIKSTTFTGNQIEQREKKPHTHEKNTFFFIWGEKHICFRLLALIALFIVLVQVNIGDFSFACF